MKTKLLNVLKILPGAGNNLKKPKIIKVSKAVHNFLKKRTKLAQDVDHGSEELTKEIIKTGGKLNEPSVSELRRLIGNMAKAQNDKKTLDFLNKPNPAKKPKSKKTPSSSEMEFNLDKKNALKRIENQLNKLRKAYLKASPGIKKNIIREADKLKKKQNSIQKATFKRRVQADTEIPLFDIGEDIKRTTLFMKNVGKPVLLSKAEPNIVKQFKSLEKQINQLERQLRKTTNKTKQKDIKRKILLKTEAKRKLKVDPSMSVTAEKAKNIERTLLRLRNKYENATNKTEQDDIRKQIKDFIEQQATYTKQDKSFASNILANPEYNLTASRRFGGKSPRGEAPTRKGQTLSEPTDKVSTQKVILKKVETARNILNKEEDNLQKLTKNIIKATNILNKEKDNLQKLKNNNASKTKIIKAQNKVKGAMKKLQQVEKKVDPKQIKEVESNIKKARKNFEKVKAEEIPKYRENPDKYGRKEKTNKLQYKDTDTIITSDNLKDSKLRTTGDVEDEAAAVKKGTKQLRGEGKLTPTERKKLQKQIQEYIGKGGKITKGKPSKGTAPDDTPGLRDSLTEAQTLLAVDAPPGFSPTNVEQKARDKLIEEGGVLRQLQKEKASETEIRKAQNKVIRAMQKLQQVRANQIRKKGEDVYNLSPSQRKELKIGSSGIANPSNKKGAGPDADEPVEEMKKGGRLRKRKPKRVVRGVGAAKRGYGKANYSHKMY